jgi:Domain of unknown function (DUF1918)
VPEKKNTRAKSTAKPTSKKADAKKAAAKRITKKTAKETRRPRVAAPLTSAKPGDVLVLDSAQVGSPPREGEVLEVIQGEVRVSYRVRWPDGRQTLISPTGGTARIVRSSSRA